jgi:hypothetical protein
VQHSEASLMTFITDVNNSFELFNKCYDNRMVASHFIFVHG